jgi:hypothetical protein
MCAVEGGISRRKKQIPPWREEWGSLLYVSFLLRVLRLASKPVKYLTGGLPLLYRENLLEAEISPTEAD